VLQQEGTTLVSASAIHAAGSVLAPSFGDVWNDCFQKAAATTAVVVFGTAGHEIPGQRPGSWQAFDW
jgi:hypothetical protein